MQIHAQDNEPTLGFRVSGTAFWNYGMPRLFVTGKVSDLIRERKVRLTQTVHHFTGPDVELNYKTGLSSRVDWAFAARYQRIRYSARDAISFSWWDRQKSLDLDMHCFSIGGRLELKRSLRPYLGVFPGYCMVSQWRATHQLQVPEVENAPIEYLFVLADGHGGGFFLDMVGGASIQAINNARIFGEFGFHFPLGWNRITIDYQHGYSTYGSRKLVLDMDTKFRAYGWLARLGVEIGVNP